MKKVICEIAVLSLFLNGCSLSNSGEESRVSIKKEELEYIASQSCIDGICPDNMWLHYAIQNLKFDVAKAFVLRGADVNAEDAEGKTPLFYFGLTQRDPDDYDVDFKSAGEFLIDHGADINHRDHYGNSPLHTTIENSRIVELLISRGADVNAKNKKGQTPLHLAAYDLRGSRTNKNVKILLNAKADVNAQDNNGLTALHYAVKSDNYDACSALLEKGADINISYKHGYMYVPLALARKENRFDLMCLLSDTRENAKILIFSDFFRAINHDDISYIKYINKKTIDKFVRQYTISPLILATMLNKVKVAEFLISRGADPAVRCNLPKNYDYLGENMISLEFYSYSKWTPLHIAVNKGYLDMVKLLSNERTVNITDENGHNPLFWAEPNSGISKILIANGAAYD